MQKINDTTNVITWFEIPVLDLKRAKRFYETILDIQMVVRADGNQEAVFFPYNPDVIQATSGRVTGVLSPGQPAENGTVVYINASPDIQQVIDRVTPAGGSVIMPRTAIPAGFIAVILDSEGNKVGLHAEQ